MMIKFEGLGIKILCFVLLCLLFHSSLTVAKTSAGLVITNQAEISWFDTEDGETKKALSNVSTVVVAQQFDLLLESDTQRFIAPGKKVDLPHHLTNTGNVASVYELRVRNEPGDSGSLNQLRLYKDNNLNGAVDAGETEWLPIECILVEVNVTCYQTPRLSADSTIEFIVSGITPTTAQKGNRYQLNIRAFPAQYDQILQGVDTVDSTKDRVPSESFNTATEATNLPSDWVNNDTVAIVVGAVLNINKTSVPACGIPLKSGEPIQYAITFGNIGELEPTADEFYIDGEAILGVMLEDPLPPNVSLNTASIPFAVPNQGIIVVQLGVDRDTQRWTRYTTWNKSDVISKIGLYVPIQQIQPNQRGKLEFEVLVNSEATATTIYNQAFFKFTQADSIDFSSNTVCATIKPDNAGGEEGGAPDVENTATIRFLTPTLDTKRNITQNGGEPDFYDHKDFEEASVYRLDSGLDSYNTTRDGVYIDLNSSGFNSDRAVAELIVVTVTSSTGDKIRVQLLETGPNTGVFRSLHPIRLNTTESGNNKLCPATSTTPEFSSEDSGCTLLGGDDGTLTVTAIDPVIGAVLKLSALISPVGVVFDSVFNGPVEGAAVWIRNLDGSAAINPFTQIEYEPQITGVDGKYQLPFLDDGEYYFDVIPTSQYSFPSTVVNNNFAVQGYTVNDSSYGKDGFDGVVNSGVFDLESLLVVDIPVDPEIKTLLSVFKTASVSAIGIGESIAYTVKIKNSSGKSLYSVKVKDSLPRGFKYIPGTTTLDGIIASDPLGASGSDLIFEKLPFIEGSTGVLDSTEHTLTYRVRTTAGAVDSDGINRVEASAKTETSFLITSNESRATVKIQREGVLSDKAIVFGKVYIDSDCNNIQSDGELPISGVKLYMEDGTWVITDANGQYSLYGLTAGNHVIKVDSFTMPKGLQFKPTDNRQMADPDSRLLDLESGEFHRADFAAVCPTADQDEIYAEVMARNAGKTDWMLQNAQKYDSEKTLTNDDLTKKRAEDGDISNGVIDDNQKNKLNIGAKNAKKSLTTGYSVQLNRFANKEVAKKALSNLPEQLRPQAFIYPLGDFFTLRVGFELDKKVMSAQQQKMKGVKNRQVVVTVYERLSDEVADRIETPRGLAKMPLAKQVVKTLTKAQAKAGTWLWPTSNISLDGRFMVSVRKGLTPTLEVNGNPVPQTQLGEQIVNKRESAQVVAWYGVQLKAGVNKLEVVAKDMFGNKRVLAKGEFTRPASAVKLKITAEKDQLSADGGRSYLPIKIKLSDENGYLARGVNFVTLETSDGQWVERDVQDRVQGHQIRVINGERVVNLRSSEVSGKVRVRISDGSMSDDMVVTQTAPKRPLIAVGMIEVGGQVFKRDKNSPNLLNEDEFNAHAAAFLKGRVLNDMYLTMSVDTDKDNDSTLFRDIDPNKSYPIHGDSSQRGYEAQSRSPVYAKLEKDDDSVMWGDFVTDGTTFNEDVTRVQRSLTGANLRVKSGSNELQVFASTLDENNIVERIRGRGVALNYRLGRSPIVTNSETIEVITVSRDNPGLVLSTVTLSRFGGYTLDDVTGELSFSETIPTVDEELNPVFIRASYDVESNGEEYIVAGVRLTHEIKPDVKVGLSYTRDKNKTDGFEVYGSTLQYKDDKGLIVKGSIAKYIPEDESEESGTGGRLHLSKDWKDNSITSLTLGRASSGFNSANAGIQAGREEVRLKHEETFLKDLKSQVEAIHSRELETGNSEQSIALTTDVKVSSWTLKGGARHVQQNREDEKERFDTVIVGAKRGVNIAGRKGNLEAEYEHAIGESGRQRIALIADMQVHEKVKLYARGERINSLTGASGLSSTSSKDTIAVGVKSNFMKSTELFSEYRVRGVIDSRDMETASGIRGTYEVAKGLSISPHLEIVNNIEGGGSDSVAASLAFKDSRHKNQLASMRLETRHDDSRDYYGMQGDYVKRLGENWSFLVKDTLRYEAPEESEDLIKNTFTVGMAYRPRRDNKYHGLFFYQNKEERGGSDGDCSTHVLSTHQNYEFNEDVLISGRLGAKSADCNGDTSDAAILDSRLTWDITRRIDMDIHGGVLGTNGMDEKNYSFGTGINFLVKENLRLGIGYNFKGFDDNDLDPQDYNDEGAYIGLQYKFDEKSLNWLTGE